MQQESGKKMEQEKSSFAQQLGDFLYDLHPSTIPRTVVIGIDVDYEYSEYNTVSIEYLNPVPDTKVKSPREFLPPGNSTISLLSFAERIDLFFADHPVNKHSPKCMRHVFAQWAGFKKALIGHHLLPISMARYHLWRPADTFVEKPYKY